MTNILNPLSNNPFKRSNTLKELLGNLPTSYLSMFDHFVGLALKELKIFFNQGLKLLINTLELFATQQRSR